MSLFLGIPPAILDLNQRGLIERAFHDSLYPNLAYRAEAAPEEWPMNTGNEVFMTRTGLLAPSVQPLTPGVDLTPQASYNEQWSAELNQYGGADDVDMPTSATANASLFMRKIHTLGLNAGQTMNRVARNAMFRAYLSGQTVALGAILIAATTIPVAALNGFRFVLNPTTSARPVPVSPATPLSIRVGAGTSAVSASVIGVIPNDPADPDGPGVLLLSAAIGTAFAATRTAVKTTVCPRVVRSSGGDSIDAIGPADTFVLQQAINAVAFLRNANVPPHEDGFYHAHISPLANAQVFADPVFQRLNQSLPEHVIYKEGFIGTISGVMFFMNSESPALLNSGQLTDTSAATGAPSGAIGKYARELGAEVVNGNGVNIGRVLITGRGSVYERWMDEQKAFMSEAGVTGKIGEFTVVNNGIQILTERIRLIIRAPIDRAQQKVGLAWTASTSFPVPSDILAPNGVEMYRRAVILEFAS